MGRALVFELQKQGYKKIAILSRNVPTEKISGVEYFSGVDLSQPQTFAKLIHANSIVINLAGMISFLRRDRSKLFATNAEGALNLLKICEQKKVQRLIQISSSAALGFGEAEISESTKFAWRKYRFLNYSHSKFFANEMIDNSKLPTNILFPPLVLGPGDPTSAERIFQFVKNKKRVSVPSGSNACIDVRDLATAIRLTVERAKPKENFLVIGENFSVKKLFVTAAKVLGQKTEFRTLSPKFCSLLTGCSRAAELCGLPIPTENIFLGFQKRVFDSRKIQTELGFRPRFSLEKSLRDSIKI